MSKYRSPDTMLTAPGAPDEEQVESLLASIQPEPDDRFYRQITRQPWYRQAYGDGGPRRPLFTRRLLGAAATLLVVLLLSIAGFASTPQGRDWARDLLRVFEPACGETLPAPTRPAAQTPSPDPTPSQPPAGLPLDEAQTLAGYKAWLPARLPLGYSFSESYYTPGTRAVTVVYEYDPPITGELLAIA
jgi:hypothetical protein